MQRLTRLHAFEDLLDSFLYFELPEGSAQDVRRQYGEWGRCFLVGRCVILEDDNPALWRFVPPHRPATVARRCRGRRRSLIEFEGVGRVRA